MFQSDVCVFEYYILHEIPVKIHKHKKSNKNALQ